MSSSNKKTFTTTDTNKQAGSTVTSDTILLEPTTTDHILVVTAENGANLSGAVDVELEMSPDGENWCPALVSEITTTQGSSGTPIVGNEKAVNLAAAGAPTEVRNKAARGRLEYDRSVDQLYSNSATYPNEETRPDAADFMHHMIAVNKSFNFSGWFKPTNEVPSATYNPVIFRQGGRDTFENTNSINLTDNTKTQNLCEPIVNAPLVNEYAALGDGSLSTGGQAVYTNASFQMVTLTNNSFLTFLPTYGEFQSNNDRMPELDDAWSFSAWFRTGTTTGIQASVFNFGSTSNAGRIQLIVSGTNLTASIGHLGSGNYKPVTYSSLAANTWYHVVYRKKQGTSDLGGGEGNIELIVNNVSAGTNNVSGLSTSNFGSGVVCSYATVHNGSQNTGGSNNSFYASPGDPLIIDEICGYADYLHDDEVTALYNNGAVVDPTNIAVAGNVDIPSKIDSWYRFGDSTNDSVANIQTYNQIDNAYRTSVGRSTVGNRDPGDQYIEKSTKNGSFTTLSTTDPIYASSDLAFVEQFKTSKNLSISGWFKTTLDATGTLFSNTGGAAATGMKMEVNANDMTLSLLNASQSIGVSSDVNDGEWHHIVMTKPSGTSPTFKIYIDGVEVTSSQATNISDDDLKGDNGFTLLGDGQNNANATSPGATDASKLNAFISNWSLHSEVLDQYAVKQLYSNGHVRNIENLPSVTVGTPGTAPAIEAWWQLDDGTNPENDLIGTNHLQYQDGASSALTTYVNLESSGPAFIQNSINGNAIILSITKSFDFVNSVWVSDYSGDAAFFLSFNGFEGQAEYFALWKCNQPTKSVNFLDGGWHNIVLSYRASTQEGDTVRFGNGSNSQEFNFNLSIDGQELNNIGTSGVGADFIGGNGSGLVLDADGVTNAGFPIYNKHLKYQASNTHEEYKPHGQGADGINQSTSVDNKYAFQSFIDETSFHSESFWISNLSFDSEKPATIYGNTSALSGTRGAGATYDVGIPYPLNDPSAIGATPGTSQYINPDRYDASTNPNGGLEAWWRWGDTLTDCAENINDVIDYTISPTTNNHDLRTINIDQTGDTYTLTTSDSVYLASSSGQNPATSGISFVNAVIEGIVDTACNVKDLNAQILQYLRVKFTGAGSVDLGKGKAEASIHWKKRRIK